MRTFKASKITLMVLTLALIVFTNGTAFAAQTDTAAVNLNVVQGLSVTNTRALEFGDIVESASSQTSTIASTDGTNTARFDVTGSGNFAYNVTVPASIDLLSVSTSTIITIDSFVLDGGAARTLSAGTDSFQFGATANIPANAEVEAYTADLTVSVAY